MSTTTAEVKALDAIIRTLQKFSQFDTKMQVSMILTLLEIARSEVLGDEISTLDIEKKVGLLSGTATRNIYYWAGGHQDVRGGHEMINVGLDLQDRRKRTLRLTPKGKAFINSIIGGIPHGETTRH